MQVDQNNIIRTISLVILVHFTLNVYSQSWDVPADSKDKSSSFTFNKETQKKGEDIYVKTCISCHGNPAQANFNKTLNPNPPDLSTEAIQNQSDGSLFYKIAFGRGLMPSFKNVLSENDRWNLISYIRSFNKKYIQPPLAIAVDSTKMLAVHVFPEYVDNKIFVLVKAFEQTDTLVLKNTEVVLFSKRYFGNLQIDSTRYTDENGVAGFYFPTDLPGDKDGNIFCVLNINDEVYGEVRREFSLKIGVPTELPSLTEKRAMWNELSKAPIWLLVTYSVVVIGIWSFLILIVLRILKINKIGKQSN